MIIRSVMTVKRAFNLFIFFTLTGFSYQVSSFNQPSVADLLENQLCKRAVNETLVRWKSEGDWKRTQSYEPDEHRFLTPTADLGHWIQLIISENGFEVNYLTARTIIKKRIRRSGCKVSSKVHLKAYDEKIIEENFNDKKLANLLKKQNEGIIYSWSPTMPMSIEALGNIKRAAKKFNVPVTAILAGESGENYLKQFKSEYKKHGFEQNDFQTMQSYELLMRGVTLHYPSVITFKDGKLLKKLQYGAENEENYEKLIKDFMNK